MTVPEGRPTPRDASAGFTLVELVVAMGVFSILMVLITGLVTQALDVVRTTTSNSQVVTQQQNAMLAIASLLRFADNPVEVYPAAPAFSDAGPSSVTFFSYTPNSQLERVPFRVVLTTCALGDTGCTPGELVARREAPIVNQGRLVLDGSGLPTFDAATTRVLVRTIPGHSPQISLTYLDGTGRVLGGCAVEATTCTSLTTTRALTVAERNSIRAVRVAVGDTEAGNTTEQTITVANPT